MTTKNATTNTTTAEQIAIPYKKILVPDTNSRQDLPRIKELAADLKEKGQLTPVVVENGGGKDQPYTLVAGSRRMAAFEMNGWTDREVLAIVREYAKGDHLARIADNWAENMQREELSPMDQAECLHQLVSGTYPVPKGEEAKPVDRDTICRRFSISKSHLGKMVKVFANVDPDVARTARRHEAPVRLLIALSAIEGEGETPEAKTETRWTGQTKVLAVWIEQQEALAAEGRQRNVRSDKGQKKRGASAKESDEDEPRPAVSPTKKIGPEGSLRRPAQDYLRVLYAKQAEAKKEERLRIDGAIDAFRFMTGEIKKLPGVTVADLKALDEADAPEEEDEGEEG